MLSGPVGPIGAPGLDGNSVMWHYDDSDMSNNGVAPNAGGFIALSAYVPGTSPYGIHETSKNAVQFLSISFSDSFYYNTGGGNVPSPPYDYFDWIQNINIGDIIYIRN